VLRLNDEANGLYSNRLTARPAGYAHGAHRRNAKHRLKVRIAAEKTTRRTFIKSIVVVFDSLDAAKALARSASRADRGESR
jgi:hypothetical protein